MTLGRALAEFEHDRRERAVDPCEPRDRPPAAAPSFSRITLDCVERRRHRGRRRFRRRGSLARQPRGEQIGDRREHGKGNLGAGRELVAEVDERSIGIARRAPCRARAARRPRPRRARRCRSAAATSARALRSRRSMRASASSRGIRTRTSRYLPLTVRISTTMRPLAEWRAAEAEPSHATHGIKTGRAFEELPQ